MDSKEIYILPDLSDGAPPTCRVRFTGDVGCVPYRKLSKNKTKYSPQAKYDPSCFLKVYWQSHVASWAVVLTMHTAWWDAGGLCTHSIFSVSV